MVHRHGFLCATAGVALGVGFQQSLGAGIFGGDGLLLKKIYGQGYSWIEGSVSFQITRVPGIRNLFFGGDGIFLAALTGPGRIWLQTLPISNLAHKLQEYLPGPDRETRAGLGAGAIGGAIASMFDNG